MYVVRNGEMHELKPDKQPIGIHAGERKTFTDWKGDFGQLDDVCVWGVRAEQAARQRYREGQGPCCVTLINDFPSKRKSPALDPNQAFPALSSRKLCTPVLVSPSFAPNVVKECPS